MRLKSRVDTDFQPRHKGKSSVFYRGLCLHSDFTADIIVRRKISFSHFWEKVLISVFHISHPLLFHTILTMFLLPVLQLPDVKTIHPVLLHASVLLLPEY